MRSALPAFQNSPQLLGSPEISRLATQPEGSRAPHSPGEEVSAPLRVQAGQEQRKAREIAARLPSKSSPVTTRRVTKDDWTAVNQFLLELDESSYHLRFGDLDREEMKDFMQNYRESFAAFVAVADEKVVGMTDCLKAAGHDVSRYAQVNIVVHGEYHGKGIGKMLVDKRDQYLRENGYTHKVELVYDFNALHIDRLRRLGWAENSDDTDEYGLIEFSAALEMKADRLSTPVS